MCCILHSACCDVAREYQETCSHTQAFNTWNTKKTYLKLNNIRNGKLPEQSRGYLEQVALHVQNAQDRMEADAQV